MSRQIDEAISRSRPDEELIWADRFGTLLLSRVAHDRSAAYSLRLSDQIRVEIVDGEPTKLESARGVSDETISHFFDDQVLPRLLSGIGKFVVHAAAINVEGSAILLIGDSGRGKSTLAASFHQQGHELLGDDAIVIDGRDGSFTGTSVYPSLRLFPDSLACLFPESAVSRRTSQYSEKRNVEFAFTVSNHDQGVSIAAGIQLSDEDTPTPTLTRLGKADACIELVKNSFALNPLEEETARKKLAFAGGVADAIPFYRFSYPRDYTRLGDVTSALLDIVSKAPEQHADGSIAIGRS